MSCHETVDLVSAILKKLNGFIVQSIDYTHHSSAALFVSIPLTRVITGCITKLPWCTLWFCTVVWNQKHLQNEHSSQIELTRLLAEGQNTCLHGFLNLELDSVRIMQHP